jgi:DHA1 family multidrug resistance protein-like MFS transporter
MALGLNNAFQSLGRVIGPAWAGATFDLNPHMPYLSAAVVLVLSFIFALWAMRPDRMAKIEVQRTSPAAFGED